MFSLIKRRARTRTPFDSGPGAFDAALRDLENWNFAAQTVHRVTSHLGASEDGILSHFRILKWVPGCAARPHLVGHTARVRAHLPPQ